MLEAVWITAVCAPSFSASTRQRASRSPRARLRKSGFKGLIVSHSMHEDEARQIMEAGADQTYLTMSEAGFGLAEHVRQNIMPNPSVAP